MLRGIPEALMFEPFLIDHLVDPLGRYRLDLDPRFPLAIKLFNFAPSGNSHPMNWHERLELFIPLAGTGSFRMGDRVLEFTAGDIVVVDNLKLHGLVEFRGQDRRAMTITFNSELIYHPGSTLADSVYLIPFHCQTEDSNPVVGSTGPHAAPIHGAVEQLVRCYFGESPAIYMQAGCKAYLLALLFQLSRHFQGAEVAHSEYMKCLECSRRFGQLFDYIQQHYARKLTIRQAAAMVGMSDSRFMKFFKQATGTTFVTYLTRVRLAKACELLRTTDLPVWEIAARVGVPDQGYFDRRFKQHFHTPPRSMRAQGLASGGA